MVKLPKLRDYYLPFITYGSGHTYTRVPVGHPSLVTLRAYGKEVDKYIIEMGTNLPGRRKILLVPINDWDDVVAKQSDEFVEVVVETLAEG